MLGNAFNFKTASHQQPELQSSWSQTSVGTSASSLSIASDLSLSTTLLKRPLLRSYRGILFILSVLTFLSIAPPSIILRARKESIHQPVTGQSVDIEQDTPSSKAQSPESGSHAVPITDISIHRLAGVIVDVLHENKLKSLAVHPCGEHISILTTVSRLLQIESISTKPLLLCLESNSGRLLKAYSSIHEKIDVFDTKFKRVDPKKGTPPPSELFVSVLNRRDTYSLQVQDLLMFARRGGAEIAVVTGWPIGDIERNSANDVTHADALFPLHQHLRSAKALEDGFVLVYDLRNIEVASTSRQDS